MAANMPRRTGRSRKPVTVRNGERTYQPSVRGSMRQALAVRDGIRSIAPESPRPVEMLSALLARPTADRRLRLTHSDQKLWEVLVHLAYEDDSSMPDRETRVELADLVRYLGVRASREDVFKSFQRLEAAKVSFGIKAYGHYYTGVSLVTGWRTMGDDLDCLEYRVPRPIREMMSSRSGEYAYLELDALRPMRSQYTLALYRYLVRHVGKRRWNEDGDNEIVVSFTPKHLAQVVGFPVGSDGRPHGGKLRSKVIDRIKDDLAEVRTWAVQVGIEENLKARGKPITGIVLTLTLSRPPLHQAPYVAVVASKDLPRVDCIDEQWLRVAPHTFRRIVRRFRKATLMSLREFCGVWMVAVHEALTGKPVTREASQRSLRADALLAAIRRNPDEAAWAFFCEEAEYPDLTEFALDVDRFEKWRRLVVAADEARRARVDWKAVKRARKRARIRRLRGLKPKAAPRPKPVVENPTPAREPVRRPPPRPAFLARAAEPVETVIPRQAKTTAVTASFDGQAAAKTLTIGESATFDDGMTITRIGENTTTWKPRPKAVSARPADLNPRRWKHLADGPREEILSWTRQSPPAHTITVEEVKRSEATTDAKLLGAARRELPIGAIVDDPFDHI